MTRRLSHRPTKKSDDSARLNSCLSNIQEWTAHLAMYANYTAKAAGDPEEWIWAPPLLSKWSAMNGADYDNDFLQELQAAQAQNGLGKVKKHWGSTFLPKVIALDATLKEKMASVRPIAIKIQNMARAAQGDAAKPDAGKAKRSRK